MQWNEHVHTLHGYLKQQPQHFDSSLSTCNYFTTTNSTITRTLRFAVAVSAVTQKRTNSRSLPVHLLSFLFILLLAGISPCTCTSLDIEELTVCSGDVLDIKCQSDEILIYLEAQYGSLNTSSCKSIPATQQDKCNTSEGEILSLYRECYPSRECYITDLHGVFATSICDVHNTDQHFYLKYTCIPSSHVTSFCDDTYLLTLDDGDTGFIIWSNIDEHSKAGGEAIMPNKTNNTLSSCTKVLTPLHGQLIHLDLITAVPAGPTDLQPCLNPSLQITAGPAEVVILCPSSIIESKKQLAEIKSQNLTILFNQPGGERENLKMVLLQFEAQGCLTTDIPVLHNKTVTQYSYGDEAIIQCGDGLYKVSSDTGIYTCNNGHWFGQDPICTELECGPVPVPENSVVIYNTSSSAPSARSSSSPQSEEVQSPVVVLQQAHTSCKEGYLLIGDSIRTCINNTWNGTQAQCSIVNCGSLPTIPNGQVTYSLSTYDSRASYSCIQGFHLLGDATRVCQVDSLWSGQEPQCSRIVCGHPGVPDNGVADPSKLSDYPTGTIISYNCDRGHNLIGSKQIICTEDGQWSDEAPQCYIIDCGPPPDVNNTQTVLSGTTFGEAAYYTCIMGFYQIQSGHLVCSINATWGGVQPNCQEITSESAEETTPASVYTSDTFPTSDPPVQQLSSTIAVKSSSTKDSNDSQKIKNGLIAGATAVGTLLLLLILWLIYLDRKRRKVRLKHLHEVKLEESGFFEKSSNWYENSYTYPDKIPNDNNHNSHASNQDNTAAQTSQAHLNHIEVQSTDLDGKTDCRKDIMKINFKDDCLNKLNGSIRSNGSVIGLQKPLHTSNIKMHENGRYQTSAL